MLQSPVPAGPQPFRQAPPPPEPPRGHSQEPGEFTRMLESPMNPRGLAGQPLATPRPEPIPGAADAPAKEGPSEFTRMFKAPPPAAPEPQPKPVKRAVRRPPVKRKKSNTGLWIAIGAAGLLVLILVVWLLFFRGKPA